MIFHGARLLPRKHTYYLPVGDNNFKKVPLDSCFVRNMDETGAVQTFRKDAYCYFEGCMKGESLQKAIAAYSLQNNYETARLMFVDLNGDLLIPFYKLGEKDPAEYVKFDRKGCDWLVSYKLKLSIEPKPPVAAP